jgi:two-component system, OmpR family, KDP operon response regulator KdpE
VTAAATIAPAFMATAKAPVILIVDDEVQVRRALSDSLMALPARVLEARTGAEALSTALSESPDLVVLDLGLPDSQGIDVCREIRRWSSAPIVVLSARHAEAEKIRLLNAGADDYVSKPFGLGEFVARVQAQLRRTRSPRGGTDGAAVIEIDGLTIDLGRREVRREAAKIKLTPTEWNILRSLVVHGGRPVSHQQIFDAVWGREYGNPQQYLRVYVTHLRRKIERDPAQPRIILTEPGYGYRLGGDEG